MSEQTAAATTAAAGPQAGTAPAAGTPAAGAQTGAAGTTAAQGATTGTPEPTPGPIPYDRFKAVNDELGQLRQWKTEQDAATAKAKKDAEAAEAKRLTEANEFKTLAEQRAAKIAELEQSAGRVATLEAAVKAVYESRLRALPEGARKAVEGLPGLTIEQRLSWLAENEALFTKAQPPNINGTAQSATATQMDEAQAAEIAAIYGVNAKYIQR